MEVDPPHGPKLALAALPRAGQQLPEAYPSTSAQDGPAVDAGGHHRHPGRTGDRDEHRGDELPPRRLAQADEHGHANGAVGGR
jgi:hypothetical protein